MHVCSTHTIWFEELIEGQIGLRFAVEALDNVFVSTLSKEIVL